MAVYNHVLYWAKVENCGFGPRIEKEVKGKIFNSFFVSDNFSYQVSDHNPCLLYYLMKNPNKFELLSDI